MKREWLFRDPGRPGLKPDLVVTTPQAVWVLDAEICGTNRVLELARRDKIIKYNVSWLKERLPHPELPRKFGSITVSMAGVWEPNSIADLQQLGITKKKMIDFTVQVLQGTLRIYRAHQDHKGWRHRHPVGRRGRTCLERS